MSASWKPKARTKGAIRANMTKSLLVRATWCGPHESLRARRRTLRCPLEQTPIKLDHALEWRLRLSAQAKGRLGNPRFSAFGCCSKGGLGNHPDSVRSDTALDDVFDNVKRITLDPAFCGAVEWLGTAWGHAVAPSTPAQDFRLHVRAWQHHFAAIFGFDALSRVRGFSPTKMALPNHPDVAYEFVRTLKDCGFRWVMVQEHSVESPDGSGIGRAHVPHRLVARNSRGETQSIIAIIKTQGSDTKLVGQMQPYYEAKGLSPTGLGSHSVPPLVTQIADGENGGVMMNEFPPKYMDVTRETSGSDIPGVNVSEYLEHLDAIGVGEEHLPQIQPIMQKRIWERFQQPTGPEALEKVIEELREQDGRFHMEGGSWTNNLSWVRGYESVLGPMEKVSALFAQKTQGVPTSDPRYRNALFIC